MTQISEILLVWMNSTYLPYCVVSNILTHYIFMHKSMAWFYPKGEVHSMYSQQDE